MSTDHHETETDEISGIIHQPTLPTMELPEYHGRKPVGMKTALAGAGTRVTRPHTLGDRIVLIIEARVKSASHEDTDDGLVYSEKLKVLDLFELDHDQGSRLISTVRSLYRTGEDAAKGRRPVPELGDVGYTDGSGVVLTPAEVAQLRGDPIRAILTPELTPAVVIYDDGARDLWPDDYPRDAARPIPGEKYLTDTGDALVIRLLHHETGETIAELDEYAPEIPAAPVVADNAPELDEAPLEQPDNVRQLHPAAEVPELPEADAYAGDLGDTVADEWETPDTRTPAEAAAEHADEMETARIEAQLPTSADFGFVDCQVVELAAKLADISDPTQLARIYQAEKQGRGRGLKPRLGALGSIGNRIAAVKIAGQP